MRIAIFYDLQKKQSLSVALSYFHFPELKIWSAQVSDLLYYKLWTNSTNNDSCE